MLGSQLMGASNYRAGESVHLCTGPLYHSAPLSFSLVLPQLFGCSVVMMDGWDAEETLRLIARNGVQWVNFVPTMMHRIWALP